MNEWENITFEYFNINLLGKEINKEIKKYNLLIFNLPNYLVKEEFLGYRPELKNIKLDEEELRNRDVIFIKRDLNERESRLTFWHEFAHIILKDDKLNKVIPRTEQEIIAETFAKFMNKKEMKNGEQNK